MTTHASNGFQLGACLVLSVLATAAEGQTQCRPATGCADVRLADVDNIVTSLMCQYNISAATVAVTRSGTLVYSRGFGWADQGRTEPIRPDAIMRLASVSKPITAAAIRDLISEGRFTLDTPAFDVGQTGPQGLLQLAPFPSLGDSRLASVTVRHLLEHTAGWDRDIVGDLKFRDVAIGAAMGVGSPPGRENVVRFVLGQPLQYAPGTTYAYSNIGYMVLGLIVEKARGLPLEAVLDGVMDSIGVAATEHGGGRTFAADQDPREPFYNASGLTVNVFDPGGALVPWPYGGWDNESSIGHGGQIATAPALATFAKYFYVSGSIIGVRRPPNDGGAWRRNHTGSLPGTNSLIRQRGDGITYAVILNQRDSSVDYVGILRSQLDALFDSEAIEWPTRAPFCCFGNANTDLVVNAADLSAVLSSWQRVYPSAELGFGDANGDGIVNFDDINAVIANWLNTCP